MKLTGRVAILFGVFTLLFGVLGMRLWFVQVAEGAEAATITEEQSWVYLPTAPPRGDIRDTRGDLLASSRYVPAVVVDRHLVQPERRKELVQALSARLSIPAADIDAMFEEAGVNGIFTVATVDTVTAYQINEQLRSFPGVRIEKVPERVYLTGDSLAHVMGQLGLPTAKEVAADPELDPNVRLGKSGVEGRYEDVLHGRPGEIAYQVRAGEVVVQRETTPAEPGDTVYLTIDGQLQRVVESALVDGISLSNTWKRAMRRAGVPGEGKNETTRAAAVVLDARTGAVRAMASYPTYDPGLFVTGIDAATYADLNARQAFINLAVSGLYPPASTFKAVTYMALLENDVPFPNGVEGVDPAAKVVHCDGRLELPGLGDGSPQIFRDWYRGDKGWLTLPGAFEQSCNIYFYAGALGIWQAWRGTPQETVIQDLARQLGFGSPTGIDLTGDAAGIVPDRELFLQWQERQREDPDGVRLLDPSRVDLADPWFGGDLMNVAIGQGSLTATPLQVAVAYAALVNGGTVWRPYVVGEVRDLDGAIVETASPTAVRTIPLDPANVEALRTDLGRVVSEGTAAAAFDDFGSSLSQVGGKTGTGQSVSTRDNHAWFAGVTRLADPEHVVVVLIDEGGSGGAVAAPVARQIMQYLMGEPLTPIVAGANAH